MIHSRGTKHAETGPTRRGLAALFPRMPCRDGMRIGGAQGAPPPSQTGQAVLPHPAFQLAARDGLAQVDVPRGSEGTRQPRSPHGLAHPMTGGPLPADEPQPSGFPRHRRAQPCGTTSVLARWPQFGSQHCLPASLCSTIITRFFAPTDALSPTGPCVIPGRGSLIHVTRTSHHSVSNHQRFSSRRAPLPQRWPHYFVRASLCARRLAKTADRIEFTLFASGDGRRYGLVVHFQLLSTRGYGPRCSYFQLLALQCRPGQGLAPCCSSALSGARAPGGSPPAFPQPVAATIRKPLRESNAQHGFRAGAGRGLGPAAIWDDADGWSCLARSPAPARCKHLFEFSNSVRSSRPNKAQALRTLSGPKVQSQSLLTSAATSQTGTRRLPSASASTQ
jgi:hypothetical protein